MKLDFWEVFMIYGVFVIIKVWILFLFFGEFWKIFGLVEGVVRFYLSINVGE